MAGTRDTPDAESGTRANLNVSNEKADRSRVGELATLQDWIDLDVENIIGIFGKPNDMRALLRRPDGEMLKVKTGDAALGGRVQAIDEEAVVIVKNARAIVLRIGKAPKEATKSVSR